MAKVAKIKVTQENKFAIADVIALNCVNVDPSVVVENRNRYFGEIINSQLRINGRVDTVANLFAKEDAEHITNLVIKRLSAPRIVRTIGTVEV